MARRRKAGLGVGQLLTLTFGFLLASVIIFVSGIWVGRGVDRDRERDDRAVVVKPVDRPDAPGATPSDDGSPRVASPDARPTRPRLREPSNAPAAKQVPTQARTVAKAPLRTPTKRPVATATKRRAVPTVPPRPTSTARAQKPTPAAKATWTVQATATNDQVQALVSARRLRSEGYQATTVQDDVGGTTWYRIQVGAFQSKRAAEKVAAELRTKGMEAAFVERLR